MMAECDRPLADWRPHAPHGRLQTDALFIHRPDFNGRIRMLALLLVRRGHENVIERGLIRPQVAAGIVDATGDAKYTGLHSLRHFYASRCINRKADGGLELPLKLVQARLGHASISITADVYGDLFPRTDDGSELAQAELRLLG